MPWPCVKMRELLLMGPLLWCEEPATGNTGAGAVDTVPCGATRLSLPEYKYTLRAFLTTTGYNRQAPSYTMQCLDGKLICSTNTQKTQCIFKSCLLLIDF